MAFKDGELRAIYDRTNGMCHICGKKLSFRNYGIQGTRAPWQVDHSVSKAAGGTNHLNNLYAACIECNLEKSSGTTRAARTRHGRTRAPLSKEAKVKVRSGRTISGAACGGAIGWLVAPELMVIGVVVGALIGNSLDVN